MNGRFSLYLFFLEHLTHWRFFFFLFDVISVVDGSDVKVLASSKQFFSQNCVMSAFNFCSAEELTQCHTLFAVMKHTQMDLEGNSVETDKKKPYLPS